MAFQTVPVGRWSGGFPPGIIMDLCVGEVTDDGREGAHALAITRIGPSSLVENLDDLEEILVANVGILVDRMRHRDDD